MRAAVGAEFRKNGDFMYIDNFIVVKIYLRYLGFIAIWAAIAHMKEKFPCRVTNLKISSVFFIFFALILRI